MTETPAPLTPDDSEPPPTGFWVSHSNLVLLTRYMADHGSTADEVAYAVEKPWKHTDVFEAATNALLEQEGHD